MGIKLIIEKISPFIAIIALLLFFISESISKYLLVYEGIYWDVPKYIKALFFLLFLFKISTKEIIRFILLILLALFFVIGQLNLENSFSTNSISTFLKYIFPILLLSFFDFENKKSLRETFFKVFEAIITINSLLIVAGFLFKIPFFETYTYGSRFGYNGLFINSTTGSYVYLISLIYYLFRYNFDLFKKIQFYIFVFSLLLVGTKVLYLSLAISLIYYFYFFSNLNFKKSLFLSILFISGVLLFITFFKWGIFNDIRQESGLLSAIFSYRNELLLQDTIPYIQKNWGLLNYFFGGVENFNLRSEFGFIDEFFFFGIMGGLLYFTLFYKSFFQFRVNNKIIIIISFIFFIVLISGNLFSYATTTIYLLVLREILANKLL